MTPADLVVNDNVLHLPIAMATIATRILAIEESSAPHPADFIRVATLDELKAVGKAEIVVES